MCSLTVLQEEIFPFTAVRVVQIRANFPGRIGEKGEFPATLRPPYEVNLRGFESERRAAGGRGGPVCSRLTGSRY